MHRCIHWGTTCSKLSAGFGQKRHFFHFFICWQFTAHRFLATPQSAGVSEGAVSQGPGRVERHELPLTLALPTSQLQIGCCHSISIPRVRRSPQPRWGCSRFATLTQGRRWHANLGLSAKAPLGHTIPVYRQSDTIPLGFWQRHSGYSFHNSRDGLPERFCSHLRLTRVHLPHGPDPAPDRKS